MLIFIGDVVLLHFSIPSDSTRRHTLIHTHYTRNKAWRQVIMPLVQSALYSIYYYYLYLVYCYWIWFHAYACHYPILFLLVNQRSRELMRVPLSEHYHNETSQPRYVELHIKLKKKKKKKNASHRPVDAGLIPEQSSTARLYPRGGTDRTRDLDPGGH